MRGGNKAEVASHWQHISVALISPKMESERKHAICSGEDEGATVGHFLKGEGRANSTHPIRKRINNTSQCILECTQITPPKKKTNNIEIRTLTKTERRVREIL